MAENLTRLIGQISDYQRLSSLTCGKTEKNGSFLILSKTAILTNIFYDTTPSVPLAFHSSLLNKLLRGD